MRDNRRMAWLEVLRAGARTTVQDRGRPGHAALGVGASGAADVVAHDAANRLVGNGPDAATLEVTLGGLRARLHGDATVAVTGAPTPLTVNGVPRPLFSRLHLRDGDDIALGIAPAGLRTYLAVRGGIDVPPVLGSRATDTLSGIGPAPVRAEDRLPVGDAHRELPAEDFIPPPATAADPVELRVRMGPRADWFTPASRSALVQRLWTVTTDTDRVGARLDGTGPLHRARTGELPSEGMVSGALQVPPNGMPVLFLADHPVTGGYPVIAVVLEDDIPAAAQLRPGCRIRFRKVL
ncbi:5-oxoprolinase/urea amidolyase family protein [Rhodococcus hoagii]|uniref:Allophanate hydrolase subunit 2 n=2 Tax=Rhodococcus hoagii TaxID=43767 RepID=A0A3S5Y2I9_RHOH1|nr:allophanate hydrolase [Prescottella equi]CBH46753.1 putative allophanate hydrolase subunit 2 [Prescottella equi 103S]MBM4535089.1 5-oxoprolinase/urea amidolyase family protein [Prescottella equi]MBM4725651.1 5-oxoprolinase/urea amidolyase family protein [Prescottella equi]NKR80802.1 5-oxoprolinase/urea amidolyase family protein [Prescottella equi]